jgi:hypothetical protein
MAIIVGASRNNPIAHDEKKYREVFINAVKGVL